MPQSVLRQDAYNCRTENDLANWNRSPRLFSNPTKQDRYGAQTFSALPGGKLSFPHGGVESVPPTKQAYAGGLIVGYMKQFGGTGGGMRPIPPGRVVDASGNYVDPSGNCVDVTGKLVDCSDNLLDNSGNRICIGAVEMPGGPAPPGPARIVPKYDVRPDRNRPIRIAGVTEGSYAPA